MGYRSRFDLTGESQRMGETAESLFEFLAKRKEIPIEPATEKQQKSHIDFFLTNKKGQKISVDVKACKKSSRSSTSSNQDVVWIEFKNVAGNRGWLYGAADYIAFERENDFVIASRSALVLLCERVVNLTKKVQKVEDALYCIYNRKGRNDEISLIKMKDILENVKTYN